MSSAHLTLAQTWLQGSERSVLRSLVLVLLGSALLAVSAKVQVPFWPVPMTMQTYVVLVLGMAYGAPLATITVGAYLLEGALGLPVFAQGGGLAYLTGPTAGYLFGFLVAASVMGKLANRGWDRHLGHSLVAMLLGHGLIFAFGVAWLALAVGVEKALAVGLTPFIAATVLKTLLAGFTLPLLRRVK